MATLTFAGCTVHMLLNPGLIFRMNTLKDRFHCRCGGSVVSKDSKGLFRPVHLARREFAAKTACVTESLGFGQISLAPTQFLLRPFTLGDVRDPAHKFGAPSFFL